MDTKKIEIRGFTDFEARKKHFASMARKLWEQAEKARENAIKVSDYPNLVDALAKEAYEKTIQLEKAGKVRLDGRTGLALETRDLHSLCGLVQERTRVYSSNYDLYLEEVYWADAWVRQLVDDLKEAGLNNTDRKKFYDKMVDLQDKDEVLAEAGLLALRKHSD